VNFTADVSLIPAGIREDLAWMAEETA